MAERRREMDSDPEAVVRLMPPHEGAGQVAD